MLERTTINERISHAVRSWDQWSPAEWRRMDDLIEEILTYCRSGRGNAFIAQWVTRFLDENGNLRPKGKRSCTRGKSGKGKSSR